MDPASWIAIFVGAFSAIGVALWADRTKKGGEGPEGR